MPPRKQSRHAIWIDQICVPRWQTGALSLNGIRDVRSRWSGGDRDGTQIGTEWDRGSKLIIGNAKSRRHCYFMCDVLPVSQGGIPGKWGSFSSYRVLTELGLALITYRLDISGQFPCYQYERKIFNHGCSTSKPVEPDLNIGHFQWELRHRNCDSDRELVLSNVMFRGEVLECEKCDELYSPFEI